MTEGNICFRCRENRLFDNNQYFYECIGISSTLCLMNRKISQLEAVIPRNLHVYIEYSQIEEFRSEINNLIATKERLNALKISSRSCPPLFTLEDSSKLSKNARDEKSEKISNVDLIKSQNNELSSEISKISQKVSNDLSELFKDYKLAKNKLDNSLTKAFSLFLTSTKRLRSELSKLEKYFPKDCSLVLVNGSTHHWKVKFPGPPHCPYENYSFEIDIRIPLQYPFDGPSIVFTHSMLHINCFPSGLLCKCIISGISSPFHTICTNINQVRSLLKSPCMNCEANYELNVCKSANEELYNKTIKDWLQKSRESSRLKPN